MASTINNVRILLLVCCTAFLMSMTALPGHAATLPVVAPVTECRTLRAFEPAVPDFPAQITEAEEVGSGEHLICRVRGYVSPQIKFEVQLPVRNWTQRFLQVGCGGGYAAKSICVSLNVLAPWYWTINS